MDRFASVAAFVRVIESGGFSAAGRHLNLSKARVSHQVQALENALGVRLLNRSTRRISLTEAGRSYYERCVQILQDLEEADEAAGAQQATPRGQLRVYCQQGIVQFVAPVIVDFLARYPEASVDLRTGHAMIDLVQEAFDLAISAQLTPDATLVRRHLPQPQTIARDTQSHRHDRVHGKRALEIGDDLIGLFAGRILGDHDKAFDRRGGIARVAGRDRNPMLGFGKGGLGITVAERPFADHIRADRRMEQRRIRPGRRLGIHDRRQRPVPTAICSSASSAVSRLRAKVGGMSFFARNRHAAPVVFSHIELTRHTRLTNEEERNGPPQSAPESHLFRTGRAAPRAQHDHRIHLRGRPPIPLHDAHRLRRTRSRRGDPAGTRRMAPAHGSCPPNLVPTFGGPPQQSQTLRSLKVLESAK